MFPSLLKSHNINSAVVLCIRLLACAQSFGKETKKICGYLTPAKAWKRAVFIFFKYNMVWSFLLFYLGKNGWEEIGLQINQKWLYKQSML